MLESYTASAPQVLGDSQSFKLPSISDAIVPGGRTEAIVFPQGENSYSSTGVRGCSFRVGRDGAAMLDPSQGVSICLKMPDTSGSTHTMNLPADRVWPKVALGYEGVEAEPIDFYVRTSTMPLALNDPLVKENLDVDAVHIGEQLIANASKTFGHKNATGLTECGRCIPFKYCQWELTLTVEPGLVGGVPHGGAVEISDTKLRVMLLEPTSDVSETSLSALSQGKGFVKVR